jgi:hypothetical protein
MTAPDDEREQDSLSLEEESRLRRLLQSAFSPQAIDPPRHERLLAAALEDPFAPPSAQEIVASEDLRRALDGEGSGDESNLNLVLARALSAAHAPSAAAPRLGSPLALTPASRAPVELRASGKVRYARFGAALGCLAAAAALCLAIGPRARHAPAPDLPALALAQSRSTAPLFQRGSVEAPSARIDRIASARERDLRANRYALWGVR